MSAHGTFMWNELMTTDTDKAAAFYGKVLGWTTKSMDMGPMGTYTIVQAGDTDAGGIMHMQGPQFDGVPPHWTAFIAVDDVDAAAGKVTEAGGEIQMPPFDVPGVGRICTITDPTGARISLMKPAEGS